MAPTAWPLLVATTAAAALSLAALLVRYLLSTRRPKAYPPGPPTILGVGNIHQIPRKQAFLEFHRLSKTYGDIIGFKVGPMNLVVLNSAQYVHELFDKAGSIYSGRPYLYIHVEHVYREHGDKHIANLQNGAYLRRWRSAVAPLVGPAGAKHVLHIQEATSATLVHKLLLHTTSPESLEHFKYWALATPLLAITGQRLGDRGKAFLDRFFHVQKQWLDLSEPGVAPPVDIFPFLRWVPEEFASWKTVARDVRNWMLHEYYNYLDTAKTLLSHHEERKKEKETKATASFLCLMAKILEESKTDGAKSFTDDQLAFLGGALLDAAVDTTYAAIKTFVLFMAAYPQVQSKAREEIDRTSVDKPPGGEVAGQLPYLRACLLEIFRLRPPAPSGLPHVAERDDTFQGYKIPKGTVVLPNVWGIQHDPRAYARPEEFRPERYLHHPQGLRPGADSQGRRATYTFGAGRRICPGEHFAMNSILVAAAKVLWTFEIAAAGTLDLAVETGFHSGLVLGPEPFEVDFVLRDGKRGDAAVLDYETSLLNMKQMGI